MRKSLMFIISLTLVVIIVGASGCAWSPSPESGSPGFVPDTDIIFNNLFELAIPVTHNQRIPVVDNTRVQGDHPRDSLLIFPGVDGFVGFDAVVNLLWFQEGVHG